MFDFVLQLRDALTDGDLHKLRSSPGDAAAREAAFRVAVAVGRCRAAMQAIPIELTDTLDATIATAAAEHGRWLVQQLRSYTSQLTNRGDADAIDDIAAADACCSVVLTRHELWAAMNAIHDTDDKLAENGQCPVALTTQLTLLIEEAAALDAVLISNIGELAAASEFPLLTNLRNSVRDASRETPWWLDGTIETVANELMKRFSASLPDPKRIESRLQAEASKAPRIAVRHDRDPYSLVWVRRQSGKPRYRLAADAGDVPEVFQDHFEGLCQFRSATGASLSCRIQIDPQWKVWIAFEGDGDALNGLSTIRFGNQVASRPDTADMSHWVLQLQPSHDLDSVLRQPLRITFTDGATVVIS